MRFGGAEAGVTGATPAMDRARIGRAGQEGGNLPLPAAEEVAPGGVAMRPTNNLANEPQAPVMTNRADAETLAPTTPPPTVAEVNAEANRTGETDGAPAARLRDFRFLTVAESARERNLENQRVRLERRLETTNNRLQVTDFLAIRIDAQLERARLERDLDIVASEIRRMRLERTFARPSVSPDSVERSPSVEQAIRPTVVAASEPQGSASPRMPVLNLLA